MRPAQATVDAMARDLEKRPHSIPWDKFNPYLKNLQPGALPAVKFQTISRPPKEVLVGRLKVHTAAGHCFVLRRFDTGAVSISTLFRACFPGASDDDEKAEMNFVARTHNLVGANGGTADDRVRFSGRWAPADVALAVATAYGMKDIVGLLIDADPAHAPATGKPRVSAAPPSAASSPTKAAANATPAAAAGSPAGPPPAKRRKDASPVKAPGTPAAAALSSPAKPPSTAEPTRRSTRTRATPQPESAPTPGRVTRARSPGAGRGAVPLPGLAQLLSSDDATVVAEAPEDADEDATAATLTPSMAEDVAAQKALIADLKAQRAAAAASASAATLIGGTPAKAKLGLFASPARKAPASPAVGGATPAPKRSRPDDEVPLSLNIQEPQTEERALVSNRRVRGALLADVTPQRKSALWGSLAFAVGLGAVTYLPNFF